MIGLMGGTFNPIHFGHLRPALEIADLLALDEVRFIPAHYPPLKKQPCVSADDRSAMVQLAIQDEPRFVLDTRELQRDRTSYTVETLRSLRHELGDKIPLCWMMGMDAYLNFTQWHQWQKILGLCHLVVSHRPNYSANNPQLSAYHTQQKTDLLTQTAGKIYFIAVTQLDISATMIRYERKQQRSIRYLVPDAVHNYINEKKLYL